MKHDPAQTRRTALVLGGMHMGATDLLGRPLFLHAEDDGTGSGAAADDAATTAADDAATGGDADDGATGGDAEGTYALPEGYEAMEDSDLRALFDTLESEVQATKDIPKDQLTAAAVQAAKSRREAQATITALLQTRIDEREALAADVASLDTDAPVLPGAAADDAATGTDAKAAGASQPTAPAAAAVSPVTAVRDRPTAPQPDAVQAAAGAAQPLSRQAAVAQTQSSWVSTYGRHINEVVAWGDMIRETKPRGTRDHVVPRPEEAVLATARVADDARNWDYELTDSASQNDRATHAAMAEHAERRRSAGRDMSARQAAICDPATIMRQAMVCGHTMTPHQAALVGMTAQSGNALKYEYRLPTGISAANGAVTAWGPTQQAAIDPTDPNTWKPCAPIACPDYTTATATEITACYEIDAFTELSSPEAEADFVHAKDRLFARFTEAWHLRETDKFLHYVSFNGDTGAVTDVIEAVLTAVVSGEYGERLEPGSFIVEGSPGLAGILATDENKKAFRSGTASMDDVLQIVADATGTDYVQLYDLELDDEGALKANPFGDFGAVGAASPTPMPRLSHMTFTLRVFDPSSIVRFDTGEAQFGDQITLDQARQNKRGAFQRIFGGQMKPGCAPGYRIDITLCADGSRGGFVAPGCSPTGFDSSGDAFVATPAG